MNDGNHYGFALPDELIMLRDQVRRFMREEVKPIEDRLPHDATGCAPRTAPVCGPRPRRWA